jgi:hypothetical protein
MLKKYKEYIEFIKYRDSGNNSTLLDLVNSNVIGLCWAASPKLLGRAESG